MSFGFDVFSSSTWITKDLLPLMCTSLSNRKYNDIDVPRRVETTPPRNSTSDDIMGGCINESIKELLYCGCSWFLPRRHELELLARSPYCLYWCEQFLLRLHTGPRISLLLIHTDFYNCTDDSSTVNKIHVVIYCSSFNIFKYKVVF